MGGMYSGKTTELERRARRYAIANKSVIVVKPKKDTRYSKDEVVSHDRIKLRAIPCDKMGDIIETLIGADIICIDEGQFISDIVEVADLLCNIGKHVIVDMLHATFDRLPFPVGDPMLLTSMADNVSFLTAICVQCGKDASNSMLVNKKDILPSLTNKDSVIIEGTDTKKDQGRYEARCRRCFMMS
jgi:thymidine kinase